MQEKSKDVNVFAPSAEASGDSGRDEIKQKDER